MYTYADRQERRTQTRPHFLSVFCLLLCLVAVVLSRLLGETGRWRSKFDVGLGLFDQGQNYANSKEAAAVCRHLRCGSMC